MTVEQMKKELDLYCETHHDCRGCQLNTGIGICTFDNSDESITEAYYTIFGKPTEEVSLDVEPEEYDVVKRPNHYCRDGAMECIEEMVLVFGKEVVKHFCLCNIWKYRYRSSAKNGEEDIKKSDQYVRIYERLCSNE